MGNDMWDFLTPNVLIAIAGGLYVLGLLIINQVVLRLFIFAGSVTYVCYYATVADEPLWGAITSTLFIAGANVLGFLALVTKDAQWWIPSAHRDIYHQFVPLRAGDFRALVTRAKRYKLDADSELTTEGAQVDTLYYVVSGTPMVTKGTATFPMRSGIFVGEVAYLRGTGSAATTRLKAGDEVLAWSFDTLRRIARRKPDLKLALDAIISKDLAEKVALAVAPTSQAVLSDQVQTAASQPSPLAIHRNETPSATAPSPTIRR